MNFRRLRNTVTSFREHFLLAIIVIMKMKGVSDIKVTGRQGSEPTFHELSNIIVNAQVNEQARNG